MADQQAATREAADRYGVRPQIVSALYSPSEVGKQELSYFQGKGLSKAAAAGIVGNTQQESSNNPNAPGGGLIQGQGGRTSHGSLQQQLDGVWGELNGPERGTLAALKGARSPQEAARIFSQKFERPGIPMLGNRERYAAEAFGSAKGAPPPGAPGTPSRTVQIPGVTSTSMEANPQAKGLALLQNLLRSEKGSGSNPLLTSGVLAREAEPVERTTTTPGATQTIPGIPGVGRAPQGGTKLGGLLPGNAPLEIQRIDKGQDIKTAPGGPLIASGDFEVVAIHNDPGGFGERYPVVRFTSGPEAGKTLYFGHTHSDLPQGHTGHAGEVISHTGYGTPREGNARTPGWAEIGLWGPGGPGGPEEGKKIAPYLRN